MTTIFLPKITIAKCVHRKNGAEIASQKNSQSIGSSVYTAAMNLNAIPAKRSQQFTTNNEIF